MSWVKYGSQEELEKMFDDWTIDSVVDIKKWWETIRQYCTNSRAQKDLDDELATAKRRSKNLYKLCYVGYSFVPFKYLQEMPLYLKQITDQPPSKQPSRVSMVPEYSPEKPAKVAPLKPAVAESKKAKKQKKLAELYRDINESEEDSPPKSKPAESLKEKMQRITPEKVQELQKEREKLSPQVKVVSPPKGKNKNELFNSWFNKNLRGQYFEAHPSMGVDSGITLIEKMKTMKALNFGKGGEFNTAVRESLIAFANSLKTPGETREFGKWTVNSINHFFDNVQLVNEKIPTTSNIYETHQQAGLARSASASLDPSRAGSQVASGVVTRSQSKQASEAPSQQESKKPSPEKEKPKTPPKPAPTLDIEAVLKSPKLKPLIEKKKSKKPPRPVVDESEKFVSADTFDFEANRPKDTPSPPKEKTPPTKAKTPSPPPKEKSPPPKAKTPPKKSPPKQITPKQSTPQEKPIVKKKLTFSPAEESPKERRKSLYETQQEPYKQMLMQKWGNQLKIMYSTKTTVSKFLGVLSDFLETTEIPDQVKKRKFLLKKVGLLLGEDSHKFFSKAFGFRIPDIDNDDDLDGDDLIINLTDFVMKRQVEQPAIIEKFINYIMSLTPQSKITKGVKVIEAEAGPVKSDVSKKVFKSPKQLAMEEELAKKVKEKEGKSAKAIEEQDKRKEQIKKEKERIEREIFAQAKDQAVNREKTEKDKEEEMEYQKIPLMDRFKYNAKDDSYRFATSQILTTINTLPPENEGLRQSFLRQLYTEFKKVLERLGYDFSRDNLGFNYLTLDIVDDPEDRLNFTNNIYFAVFNELNTLTDISVTRVVKNLGQLRPYIIENMNQYAKDYSRTRFGDTSTMIAAKKARGEKEVDISELYGSTKQLPPGQSFELGDETIGSNTIFDWDYDISVYFEDAEDIVNAIAKGRADRVTQNVFVENISNQSSMFKMSNDTVKRVKTFFEGINETLEIPFSPEQYELFPLYPWALDARAAYMFLKATRDLFLGLQVEDAFENYVRFVDKYRQRMLDVSEHMAGYHVDDDLDISDVTRYGEQEEDYADAQTDFNTTFNTVRAEDVDLLEEFGIEPDDRQGIIESKKSSARPPSLKYRTIARGQSKYLFKIWLDENRTRFIGITA